MKNALSIIVIFFITAGCTKSNDAIEELCQRILPEHYDQFVFDKKQDSSGFDYFEIESKKDKIVISGNNNNSMAVGLNYYLKYYCNVNISWNASDKIVSPDSLPSVKERVLVNAICQERFFLNYCTFGYTMPFWSWSDWERAIDWMALNGITMPLAITGQESIWLNVWKKLGIEENEILNYFTGPAHLPWHRMSNVDYWQGPLPKSWLEGQNKLQKKILKRERELNMTPVLPAFSGHVPRELKERYPNADIKTMSGWGGYDEKYRSHFLYPMDSLFTVIQNEYMKEMIATYGTDHIYGIDPFNEVESPDWSPEYLSTVSKTIYKSISDVDPNATWVQMTWMLYHQDSLWTKERMKAYLTAVPKDKLILLDYYCDSIELWRSTDSFFDQPFIWCYLGNFGGNTMMTGDLNRIKERITQTSLHNKNLKGIGSTLEGFDVNPFVYEYLFESAWNSPYLEPDLWIEKLALRRGGENVVPVWKELNKTVYKDYARAGQSTLTNARPTLDSIDSWNTHPDINYDNAELYKIWVRLINSNAKECDAYNYDLVNIGRQVLGNRFLNERVLLTKAYRTKDLKLVQKQRERMTGLLNDLESLLNTHKSFMVGCWIEKARQIGIDSQEKDYYQENSQCILTTWGQKGSQLNDYANRTWGGLVDSYYKVRWEEFIKEIQQSIIQKKEFDYASFKNRMIEFEQNWSETMYQFPTTPQANSLDVARELANKYKENL